MIELVIGFVSLGIMAGMITYVITVSMCEIDKLIKTRLDLILSFIVPFYLWFIMLRDKWNELD